MNQIFTDKSPAAVFLKIAIEDALAEIKPFIGTNKKSADNFLAATIRKAQLFRHSGNPYYNVSAMTVRNGLQLYDIKTSAELISAIVDAKNALKGKKENESFAIFLKNAQKIRKANNTVRKVKKFFTDEGLDNERTIAIRSQFGGFPVIFYPFMGVLGKDTAHQLNMLKLDYHYSTGCPYYQARPILLSTWQTLDEEHQQASSVK